MKGNTSPSQRHVPPATSGCTRPSPQLGKGKNRASRVESVSPHSHFAEGEVRRRVALSRGKEIWLKGVAFDFSTKRFDLVNKLSNVLKLPVNGCVPDVGHFIHRM